MNKQKFINAKSYLRNFSKEEISKNLMVMKAKKMKQIGIIQITLLTPKKLSMRDFRQIFTLTNFPKENLT